MVNLIENTIKKYLHVDILFHLENNIGAFKRSGSNQNFLTSSYIVNLSEASDIFTLRIESNGCQSKRKTIYDYLYFYSRIYQLTRLQGLRVKQGQIWSTI